MGNEPTALAYALPDDQAILWRRARILFAGFAVAYGVVALLVGFFAWYSSWMWPSLPWFAWVPQAISALSALPIGIGGLLSLNGRRAGPIVIRYGAVAAMIGSLAISTLLNSGFLNAGMAKVDGMTMALRMLLSSAQVSVGAPTLLFLLSFPLRDPPR